MTGVPEVVVTEQGGLGDIIAGPTFTTDGTVYLSWVEGSDGATGAVVGTAHLDVAAARLTDVRRIWRQTPEIDGGGHYSHRLAIHDEHLFVSSGDRQQFTPAQELDTDLGKILRLTLDGKPAPGNPFQDDGPPADGFWSIGHRNPLGLAFDADGRLWSSEMGPKGGDEINLIRPGANYGWPEASNGSNYDGSDIPDHRQGDGFTAPLLWWNPSISPGSLMIYGATCSRPGAATHSSGHSPARPSSASIWTQAARRWARRGRWARGSARWSRVPPGDLAAQRRP
ncbi:PQQ-dependent sugar dehydrogenase [Tessaracoccus sp. HDW20]|nr:PQQ-dependent sugar dehydrogenase [Tessaracoccus coleopterorum]